jgi:hypothetical protein
LPAVAYLEGLGTVVQDLDFDLSARHFPSLSRGFSP